MHINSKSIMELNANQDLGSGANVLGKSLEKLSSGYRINRAGDSDAVLIIPQKLRDEIGKPEHGTRKGRGGLPVLQMVGG